MSSRRHVSTRNSSNASSSGRTVILHRPGANSTMSETWNSNECSRLNTSRSFGLQTSRGESVGDMSHIPRAAPSRTTYTIPCLPSNNTFNSIHEPAEDLFGLVKLKENDVCYTSGTIEWVGRKRSFPINSGFKLLNEAYRHEPLEKKVRSDATYTCNTSQMKDCDCADVLPTVNAIVDHLNALHEAVDLVDLRVNTLENVI